VLRSSKPKRIKKRDSSTFKLTVLSTRVVRESTLRVEQLWTKTSLSKQSTTNIITRNIIKKDNQWPRRRSNQKSLTMTMLRKPTSFMLRRRPRPKQRRRIRKI